MILNDPECAVLDNVRVYRLVIRGDVCDYWMNGEALNGPTKVPSPISSLTKLSTCCGNWMAESWLGICEVSDAGLS